MGSLNRWICYKICALTSVCSQCLGMQGWDNGKQVVTWGYYLLWPCGHLGQTSPQWQEGSLVYVHHQGLKILKTLVLYQASQELNSWGQIHERESSPRQQAAHESTQVQTCLYFQGGWECPSHLCAVHAPWLWLHSSATPWDWLRMLCQKFLHMFHPKHRIWQMFC